MAVKDITNMSIVATLLDKARTRRGIPTDMALAERLGRSRAVVSEWRAGKSYPDEDLIVALAELAGDDPGEWLLAVKAVRTDGKAGKVWAALARRLGTTTAALAVGVLGVLTAHASGHDIAGLIAGLPFLAIPLGGDVHYAKLLVGLAVAVLLLSESDWPRYLVRILRDWLAHRLQRPKPSPEHVEAFAWI